MLRCNNYVFAKTIDEAYELNQKKNNVIVGGNGWLKMGNKNWNTAIDISRLGLDKINEDDEKFSIGAMVTLRELELNKSFNLYTNGAIKECLKHIVGTQFRNTVTIGGSIYGRFGFSDPLTLFLVMDSYVKLYKGGIVSLDEYSKMPYDRDIVMEIIVYKKNMDIFYSSFRNQSTDFPVVTCAVSKGEEILVSVGATPKRAKLVKYNNEIKNNEEFAKWVSNQFEFGDNMRASGEYRKHIAYVLSKRIAERLDN
ncbi:MAG: FAD binding domain-containing protein [Lachnospirales bacterium]